jgi:ribosome-associated protein
MARRRREDAEADEAYTPKSDDEGDEVEGRGRTKRKRASHEITDLGVELASLGAQRLAGLPLPESLRDALAEARRLTSFGAQRRQAQFIGKLMRRLDEAALAAVRAAVNTDRARAARGTAVLHRAERWRDSLVEDDAALERWLGEHPRTDAQQLRALIRQARKDAQTERKPGEAPRKGRAYRQIFALVHAALGAGAGPGDGDQ